MSSAKSATAKSATDSDAGNWVNKPLQARSLKTQQAIMDAAEALINEKGFDEVSVADIAARSGCSVGAFYRRFRDKEALLHAIHERYVDKVLKLLDISADTDLHSGLTIEEVLDKIGVLMLGIAKQYQPLLQLTFSRAVRDPLFAERVVRVRNKSTKIVRDMLLAHRDEMKHPEPEKAVETFLLVSGAAFSSRIETTALAVEPEYLTDEELIKEMTRLGLKYLGISQYE